MEEPLLFIPTPPFYYIEVEDEPKEEMYFDESTSIYEISRAEKINSVVAKQLHYFSQPPRKKSGRYIVLHLKNNGKVTGIIEEFDGFTVKVKTNNTIETIYGNEIVSITTTSKMP